MASVATTWRQALVTKDDPIHLHKTLGLACLLSFAWRLSIGGHSWGEADLAFASHPKLTLPTICLHLLLNVSSLLFQIPPRRIKSGFRIWPEYRLHSLVFTCRSLAFLGLLWYKDTFAGKESFLGQEERNIYVCNLFIVLATMASADWSSRRSAGSTSGFARQLQVPHPVKYIFSVLQIHATTGCLLQKDRYSMHFVFIMIIQVNAFLMTLRRKNLAGHYPLVSVYGIMLTLGYGIGLHELWRVGVKGTTTTLIVANVATLMRLGPRHAMPPLWGWLQSKYVMWPCMHVLFTSLLYPIWQSNEETVLLNIPLLGSLAVPVENGLVGALGATTIAVAVLGWYKTIYEYPNVSACRDEYRRSTISSSKNNKKLL